MSTSRDQNNYLRLRLASLLLVLVFVFPFQIVAATEQPELPITQVGCESMPNDSDENGDGSVTWIPTHRIKPAIYHKLITRYASSGAAVTLDYLLYEPDRKPHGLIILLSGGAMEASLKSNDGKTVNHTGANFLIRSSHYFVARGYRVIGMNRPDDYRQYGNIDATPELYDGYRTSMAHAVDIAMVIHQHGVANTPVILVGSSRGVISAFAQQALANVIVLFSPVTSGGGTPLGSSVTSLHTALRPSVILFHHSDACPASQPKNTIQLAQTIYQHVQRVALFEITNGIRDGVSDDPCAALDHHGFAGIEGCAINTSVNAVENLLARNPKNNHLPIATDATEAVQDQSLQFSVRAHDADTEDVLRYSVPSNRTVLGGKIVIDSHSGRVSYQRPVNLRGRTDRFVYSVSDGEGGVSVGIVSLILN